jgi:hypothetical protein
MPAFCDAQPGPSSQTTSVVIENLIVEDAVDLTFSDTSSVTIKIHPRSEWQRVANSVLRENKELWERLAKL